jgi:uncharacterized membrane protein
MAAANTGSIGVIPLEAPFASFRQQALWFCKQHQHKHHQQQHTSIARAAVDAVTIGSPMCIVSRTVLPLHVGCVTCVARDLADYVACSTRHFAQGHYSCCCGDTWASELGMLSSSRPRLISSMAHVPPGTNGGVTLLGLAAGAAGGLAMGLVTWAAGSASGELPGSMGPAGGPTVAVAQGPGFWLGLGAAAGLAGSLIDSLLGATLQYSGWCSKTQRVVAQTAPHVQRISGRPLLSNNQVNTLAALCTSAGCVAVAWWRLSAGKVVL